MLQGLDGRLEKLKLFSFPRPNWLGGFLGRWDTCGGGRELSLPCWVEFWCSDLRNVAPERPVERARPAAVRETSRRRCRIGYPCLRERAAWSGGSMWREGRVESSSCFGRAREMCTRSQVDTFWKRLMWWIFTPLRGRRPHRVKGKQTHTHTHRHRHPSMHTDIHTYMGKVCH